MALSPEIELYVAGSSLRTVAAAFGLSRSGVHYRLVRAGIPRRPNGTAHLRQPDVEVRCAYCDKTIVMRPYVVRFGGGSRRHPRPAKFHLHPDCRSLAARYAGGIKWVGWLIGGHPVPLG